MRFRVWARWLLAVGCLLPVGVLGGDVASADAYPPSGVHVVTGSVSATTVTTGSTVTFSGAGFAPSSRLRLSVAGSSRGTTTRSAVGAFSVRLRLTGGGAQVLAASGLEPTGRLRVVSVSVTVTGAGAAPLASPLDPLHSAALPPTVADHLAPALAAGLGSVAAGTGLVLFWRARRRGPRQT